MELWNMKDLESPPVTTYKASKCDMNMKLLRKTARNSCKFYENQEYLHREAALLSRCIYRMKKKFQNSKDFKFLEKINRILLNYLKLNAPSIMRSFSELIPNKWGLMGSYLPTKNFLDYILVRLQGLAKLMCRLVKTTTLALQYFQDRIQVGHFWNIAVIGLGLVSRFHALGRNILLHTCDLYDELLPFNKKLQNVNDYTWLPVTYKLPKNLRKWLGVPWLNEFHQSSETVGMEYTDTVTEDLTMNENSDDDHLPE